MTAEELIKLLAERRLVSDSVLAALRRQVAHANKPVRATSIIRKLLETRRLTEPQARDLLQAVEAQSHLISKPGYATLDEEGETSGSWGGNSSSPNSRNSGSASSSKDSWGKKKSGRRSDKEEKDPSAPPLEELLAEFAEAESPAYDARDVFSGLPPEPPRQSAYAARRSFRAWDSPWILMGAGAVLALLLLGPVLSWAIRREDADQTLKRGMDEFQSKAFAAAIEAFDVFLKRFPSHKSASQVRVLRGMADIQQFSKSGSGWVKTLQRQKELLPKLAEETAFRENRQGLAEVLVETRIGLAESALQSLEQALDSKSDAKNLEGALEKGKQLLQMSTESLEMLRVYTLPATHPQDQLTKGDEIAAIVQNKVQQAEALQSVLTTMRATISSGDVKRALEAVNGLIRRFPEVEGDDRLTTPLAQFAAELAKSVQVKEDRKAPESVAELPKGALGKFFPREVSGDSYSGLAKKVIPLQARGVICGVDGATGKILWRHSADSGAMRPVLLGDRCVFVADDRRSLVSVDLVSGKPQARQVFPSDLMALLTDGTNILAFEQVGHVHWLSVNLEIQRGSVLPQALSPCCAVDAGSRGVFVLAESGYAYRLSLEDGKCTGCLFIGHAPNSTIVPCVYLEGTLVVPVTRGSGGSFFALGDDERGIWTQRQRIDLQGALNGPLSVVKNRLAAADSRGGLLVFQVQQDRATPLTELAVLNPAESASEGTRYGVLIGDTLCAMSQAVVGYRVQATTQRIDPLWKSLAQQRVLAPPWSDGKALVVAHAGEVSGEVRASLISPLENGKVYWTTLLAAPATKDGAMLQSGTPLLRLANGQLWSMAEEDEPRYTGVRLEQGWSSVSGVQWNSVRVVDFENGGAAAPLTSLAAVSALGQDSSSAEMLTDSLALGRFEAVSEGPAAFDSKAFANTLVTLTPAGDVNIATEASGKWRVESWPKKIGSPAPFAPAAFGSGLLLGDSLGRLYWKDKAGQDLAWPFHPPLRPGEQVVWRRPCVLAENRLAIHDGRRLFMIGSAKGEGEESKLELVYAAVSEATLLSPFVAADKRLYALDSDGDLRSWNAEDFSEPALHDVPAPLHWGPLVHGRFVLMGAGDTLIAFAEGKQAWSQGIGDANFPPTFLQEDRVLLASPVGRLLLLNLADGKLLHEADLAISLTRTPLVTKRGLLASSQDGAWYVWKSPLELAGQVPGAAPAVGAKRAVSSLKPTLKPTLWSEGDDAVRNAFVRASP